MVDQLQFLAIKLGQWPNNKHPISGWTNKNLPHQIQDWHSYQMLNWKPTISINNSLLTVSTRFTFSTLTSRPLRCVFIFKIFLHLQMLGYVSKKGQIREKADIPKLFTKKIKKNKNKTCRLHNDAPLQKQRTLCAMKITSPGIYRSSSIVSLCEVEVHHTQKTSEGGHKLRCLTALFAPRIKLVTCHNIHDWSSASFHRAFYNYKISTIWLQT